jgi:Skp family chaperone for outer membrane proteins
VKYWLVLVLVALSWVPGWAQDRMKIGFIDVRRVVSESAAGKRAGDRLQIQVK